MKQSKEIIHILQSFEFIRNDIEEAHGKLDNLYEKATKARNTMPITDYKPEIARQKIDELSRSVRDTTASYREIGLLKLTADFDDLRESIRAWMMMPPPDDFIRTVKTYEDFKLTPSREEVESLNLSAGDNYIAQRILSQLAEQTGFESGYPDGQDIAKMVATAEKECRHVIADYIGAWTDNNKLAGGAFEQIDFVTGGWTRNCYAADYMSKDDTTLAEVERVFRRDAVELMPSIVSKLDEVFNGCRTEDDKIEVAARLIETDNRYEGWLSVYDSKLFAAAVLRANESSERQLARLAEEYKDAEDALRQQVEVAASFAGKANKASKASKTA